MTALGHGAFVLSGDCIAVWSLRTDVSEATAAKFEPFLSVDEKERAARCRFEGLRVAFSVTRGALRYLLGRYLKLHPELIRFKYGPKGKPALALDIGIEFNTTHSGDLAAFAFAADCEVGIDLEKIRPLPEVEDIANRFFSKDEAIELASLAPEERLAAFYRCWTGKEAYLKAVGCGLSAPLDEFRVSLTADETTPLIQFGYDRDAVKPWTLHDLSVGPDYAGALAYRDRPRFISLFPTIDPIELFDLAGH
jgi:4'-phosphopantetheinyl transferase